MKKNSRTEEPSFELDFERRSRCGFPEFIYGEGKSLSQLEQICDRMLARGEDVLISRLAPETASRICEIRKDSEYDQTARILRIGRNWKKRKIPGLIYIASAGTTDLPVALEAKLTAEFCGCRTELASDIGVAGIHRTLSKLDCMRRADVVIAVAGMEGALPSVIGGLVACPVIAVPTSVGYGSSMNGIAALLAMLNSCASGICVVNIDNGFGAACAAIRILNSKKTKGGD